MPPKSQPAFRCESPHLLRPNLTRRVQYEPATELNNCTTATSFTSLQNRIMADIEQEFQLAAKQVSDLKTRPTDQELLTIYALYKQATVGDCDQPRPGMFALKEKAKHEAWTSRKGTSKDEAKKEYIAMVKKMVAQYS